MLPSGPAGVGAVASFLSVSQVAWVLVTVVRRVWDADTGKLLVKIRTPGGNWQVLWRPDGEEIATLTR